MLTTFTGRLADAQLVGQELEKLAEKHGALTAEVVVDAARSKNSALHRHFTWDDTAAATKCRLFEAGQLIRRVKVTVVSPKGGEAAIIRAFVSIATIDDESNVERSYVPVRRVIQDPAMREQMLATALKELSDFKAKYAALQELAGLFTEIEKVAV